MSHLFEMLKASNIEAGWDGECVWSTYIQTFEDVLSIIEERLLKLERTQIQEALPPSAEIRGSEALNANPEIVACNSIIQALQALPDESRCRVMEYAAQRMGIRVLHRYTEND